MIEKELKKLFISKRKQRFVVILRRHLESVIVVMFTLCVKGEIYNFGCISGNSLNLL